MHPHRICNGRGRCAGLTATRFFSVYCPLPLQILSQKPQHKVFTRLSWSVFRVLIKNRVEFWRRRQNVPLTSRLLTYQDETQTPAPVLPPYLCLGSGGAPWKQNPSTGRHMDSEGLSLVSPGAARTRLGPSRDSDMETSLFRPVCATPALVSLQTPSCEV